MTLRALLDLAGRLLRGLPETLWVEASVVACKAGRLGHALELVEAGAAPGQGGTLRVFLPAAVLERLAAELGGPVDPEHLVGTTTLLKVTPQWNARYHLGARVLDLGREATLSLARHRVELLRQALRREALYDRQRRLPAPRDVTRVAVVHPLGAAGHADIAGELGRWERAGLIALRCHPATFEGEAAPQAIAAALRAAVQPLAGSLPDLVLMVRGGGARSGLEALDHEIIARAVALCPVPVVCGLGHAIDRALVDELAWQSRDTPSKALALVAELMRAPAARARSHLAAIASLGRQHLTEAALALATRHADAQACVQRCATQGATDLSVLGANLRVLVASADARCRTLADDAGHRLRDVLSDAALRIREAERTSREQQVATTDAARRRLATCDTGERAWSGLLHTITARLDLAGSELAHLHAAADAAALRRLDQAADALAATEAVVAASSLENTLRRGFAVVTDTHGVLIRTVAAARAAQDLTLLLADGDVAAAVEA